MKLLLVVAAALAVASCASISLEDLEFHAWKLKFGEILDLLTRYLNVNLWFMCVAAGGEDLLNVCFT